VEHLLVVDDPGVIVDGTSLAALGVDIQVRICSRSASASAFGRHSVRVIIEPGRVTSWHTCSSPLACCCGVVAPGGPLVAVFVFVVAHADTRTARMMPFMA
jgi:hypothetical protein